MSNCHVCGADNVRELPQYASLTRVTSDCKPWPAGGRLGMCVDCGTVQKFVDEKWRADIAGIYADYTIYFQAGSGAEQVIFLDEPTKALTRSEWLVRRVVRDASLAPQGRLLDIGCGNGAFLRAFSRSMPGWTLTGTELSDGTRDIVESIPGVEGFYTGPLDAVPGTFDLISLVHVLEHISHPLQFLPAVTRKLKPGGVLFVEVPDAESNPFDLLIADHISHFTPSAVARLLTTAGYSIGVLSNEWLLKEISAIARYGGPPILSSLPTEAQNPAAALNWLVAASGAARAARARASGRFGLFGSSIAATWLAHEVGCAMEFFVDEDPSRQGQQFMGRSVVSPGQVTPGSVVFIGVGGGVAGQIADRLSRTVPSVTWIPAPPFA